MLRLWTLTAAVWLLVSMGFTDAADGAPRLPATFIANDCSYGAPEPRKCPEPLQPAFLGFMRGCGFVVGRPVLIHDEVILRRGLWPIDPRYEGQYRQVWDAVMPDANGCIYTSYQAWGSGTHEYRLYQQLHSNPNAHLTLMAFDRTDVWFHHLWYNIDYQPPWPYTGDIYYIPPEYIPPGVMPILNIDAFACMTYSPPRTPGSPFWPIGEPNNYDACFTPT